MSFTCSRKYKLQSLTLRITAYILFSYSGNENVSEVVADYFSFLVQDNSGLFSIPANVTLSAITSLSAIDTVYHVLEDRLTAIQVCYNCFCI